MILNDFLNVNGRVNSMMLRDSWMEKHKPAEYSMINEFVVDNNEKEIYMYDILFCKGEDVRKRYLINLQKDSKIPARLELLNKFSKSKSRVIDNEKYIILKEKQYKYSTRADGTDIFQKIKDIWDTRK